MNRLRLQGQISVVDQRLTEKQLPVIVGLLHPGILFQFQVENLHYYRFHRWKKLPSLMVGRPRVFSGFLSFLLPLTLR